MDADAPIRVALISLAPLVRDVVHELIDRAGDMSVAAVVEPGETGYSSWHDAADVYLVGVGDDDPTLVCEPLLGEPTPPRRVIAISSGGRRMHVSELRPTTLALGSLSSDELLAEIRLARRPHLRTPPDDAGRQRFE